MGVKNGKREPRTADRLAARGAALGTKKTAEADHLTRLRAVERYCELLEMAQGKLPEEGT